MERIFIYQIQEAEAGQTLLDFLRAKGYSRHMLTGFKTSPGSLLLNNGIARGHALLGVGDCIRVRLADEKASEKIPPVFMPLHILYEDEDILVLNKAADTPIHPSVGNYENTLANGVAWYYAQKGEAYVFRCINRLDRDTTGALILAKNALSAAVLSAQMKAREIHRTYLALAEGKTPLSGTIQAPIARVDSSAILREVNYKTGESACTHFQRLDFHNGLSLLELHLESGRTHQIRVHMKHLGFPLTGDFLYNPNFSHIHRQALHSYQLVFRHPITGKALIFQAPVPEDMRRAFLSED
ncbi:MAG: RluA family pseudouridine synthase [Eubacteriales bacterium]|nr:RluA family pseudouridine synthase [Eubacteriales bacterium]